MRTIVAIGGGRLGEPKLDINLIPTGEFHNIETTLIDEYIVKLSSKKNPNFLFIPTAANDRQGYCEVIKKQYEKLGCNVSFLFLVTQNPSNQEIKEKILTSDIIYVSGGNTKVMLDIWEQKGIIPLLKEAYNNGIILCGLSAGANCWFEKFSTDSFLTEEDKLDFDKAKEKLAIIDGLGYLKGIICPHYLFEPYRRPAFLHQMKNFNTIAYGVDNNTALVFIDENFKKVIKSNPNSQCFEITSKNGNITEKELF